jgi:two-component system cell cycle response regulator
VRILIADDDVVSRKMLAALLMTWGYEVSIVSDGVQAWRLLQDAEAPRLAILDGMMPGLDGRQLCRMVRNRQTDTYTYLLLVTAKSAREEIVGGLEAGADDYLIKPFEPLELKARLITGRRILGMQEQLLAAREALRHQALTDSLTGVWNRRAIMDILAQELERSRREGGPLAVVLADLDHFKRINDTCGHLGGDEVLREAARRMKTILRPYDLIGRYGGEEFLIVLPGCSRPNAVKCAERVRACLAAEPVRHQDQSIGMTGSFGVVVFQPPAPGESQAVQPGELQRLLHAVDGVLYQAKRAGRNRVEGGELVADSGVAASRR